MLPSNTHVIIKWSLYIIRLLPLVYISIYAINETQIYSTYFKNGIDVNFLRGFIIEYYFKGNIASTVGENTPKHINADFEEARKKGFNVAHFVGESSPIEIFPTTEVASDDNEVRSSSLPSSENITLEKNSFFVVTAIFNPLSYQSRYNIYHDFVKHMNETGAQLITIECIFPSLNQHEFQVTDSSNPFHIQLKSESIYWMKENLINIAVSRLPSHAKWVCWLDADINFHEPDWVKYTIKELQSYIVVQIFEKANFLGPPPQTEILGVDYSFGFSAVHNKPIDSKNNRVWYPHPGYGWAMSVKDYLQMNGLPIHNFVGGGDRFFAYSLINRTSDSFSKNEFNLPTQFKQTILDFGNQSFNSLHELSKSHLKKIVGYVPVTISHNWHGSTKNRQYDNRWKICADNNFNFNTDARVNDDGLYQLNPNKPNLQADILAFFQKRHEDKTDTDDRHDRDLRRRHTIREHTL